MKYIDYGTMQSEAQRRVFEMQKKAYGAVRYQAPAPDIIRTEDTQTRHASPEPQKELFCGNENKNEITAEPDCDNAPECTGMNLQPILKHDPEQLLLLAILVLMLAEKADMLLILALIYLMM